MEVEVEVERKWKWKVKKGKRGRKNSGSCQVGKKVGRNQYMNKIKYGNISILLKVRLVSHSLEDSVHREVVKERATILWIIIEQNKY